MSLSGRNIILGVTGGIAAYKSAYLIQELRSRGAEVRVVMTPAAQQFIGAQTLQALSGHVVTTEASSGAGSGMEHIDLARWADAMIVAPLSANTLAKLAHGDADNILTCLYLACSAPLLVAPAMNPSMWQHAAVQDNIKTLLQRGEVRVQGPGQGTTACGDIGIGRMSEPQEIVAALERLFNEQSVLKPRILITAGPTFEPIDAVRYIGNRSSGKMGFALAASARRHGKVLLIAGPVAQDTPKGVDRINVSNAQQMHDEVMRRVESTDILIACAAVADYRCSESYPGKLKKSKPELQLKLVRVPDILSAVTSRADSPFCVGFAAETEALEANAKSKLLAKNLDMVIANEVGGHTEYGFDSDENLVDVYWRSGSKRFGPMLKTALAEELMSLILQHSSQSSRMQRHG